MCQHASELSISNSRLIHLKLYMWFLFWEVWILRLLQPMKIHWFSVPFAKSKNNQTEISTNRTNTVPLFYPWPETNKEETRPVESLRHSLPGVAAHQGDAVWVGKAGWPFDDDPNDVEVGKGSCWWGNCCNSRNDLGWVVHKLRFPAGFFSVRNARCNSRFPKETLLQRTEQ